MMDKTGLMRRAGRGRARGYRLVGVLICTFSCAYGLVSVGAGTGCGSAPQPLFIEGVTVSDNEAPTLIIIRPIENLSISQGSGFTIEWRDTDSDDDAQISFSLVSINDSSQVIPLVSGLRENEDLSGDRFTAQTQFVPIGTYNLRGRISDGVSRAITATAQNTTIGAGPVVITVVEQGATVTVNRPPQLEVIEPAFNRSVSQDDTLNVVVRPTRDEVVLDDMGFAIEPYDPDNTTTLYALLDLDSDPTNDNVAAPDPSRIILLGEPMEIQEGTGAEVDFSINVDVEQIPIREDGSPYYIRATIVDGVNAPIHSYAAGTINVVRAASRNVDLGLVGKTISGALFRGFNPGSNLGTRMTTMTDFDGDGIDDFMLVAQFGNPRNFGNAGEAYLIYGQNRVRFGGEINVNSVSRSIPGAIFEGPPTRCSNANDGCMLGDGDAGLQIKDFPSPRTDGITDVTFIPDLDADGRPEIMIGMSHVDGVYQSRDDDPDDNPPDNTERVPVRIILRQGTDGLQVRVGEQDNPDQGYFGVEDTTICTSDPDTSFRTDDLAWRNNGPNDMCFVLIKFADLLDQIPPADQDLLSITGESAEIRFNVIDGGTGATIHALFEDFDSATTFNSFLGGAMPLPGVHYEMEEIEEINDVDVGDDITIDLDELITQFVFGELLDNELRLIIVPDEEDEPDDVRLSPSEEGNNQNRPTLQINYTRTFEGGNLGCYPDSLPNNYSDDDDGVLGLNENKVEALGFVSLMSSQNRDISGVVDVDRLTNAIVPIEMIGQRSRENRLLSGQISVEVEADEDDRIDGIRFQAGWYDFWDAPGNGDNQPPLNGLFGRSVSWIEDQNLDGVPEVIISAPGNELDHLATINEFGANATHVNARSYTGSVIIIPGENFDDDNRRDKGGEDGTSCIPTPDDERTGGCADPGTCDPRDPFFRCGTFDPLFYEIFAETPEDFLGGARSGGDVNLDSVPDFICGAPLNDRTPAIPDTGDEGAFYVIFGRSPVGNFNLALADDPNRRPPMIRIRGETPGDQIGWKQEPLSDVNGDGTDDVAFSSPTADFIVSRPECEQLPADFLSTGVFNACVGLEVAMDDFCKPFDFDNDRIISERDREVLLCLIANDSSRECCPTDNGFVGVLFGGISRQGDRTISQLGTNELPGVVFYGTNAGDRAGYDIASAGDFDNDGFGDLLITAPGESRVDNNNRERMGVTYLVFGGPHLQNREAPIELSEIGESVPGIIFLSPYEMGGLDEAPTDYVGLLGDINNDGFDDIAIGVSLADLLDDTFPQGDGDANSTGRRPNQGDAYVIYGSSVNR